MYTSNETKEYIINFIISNKEYYYEKYFDSIAEYKHTDSIFRNEMLKQLLDEITLNIIIDISKNTGLSSYDIQYYVDDLKEKINDCIFIGNRT